MIDINLNFGADNLAENLTFVLARRDESRIGLLSAPQDVTANVSCDEAPEISVKFYKVDNPYWDDINMFKIIYVPELDTYYSIECESSEGDSGEYKALTLKRLAESELEQINVYGLQINTEEEIILPDYDSNFPNVLWRDLTDIHRYDDIWNSDEKYEDYTDEDKRNTLRNSSILHRVLSFAPHYSIGHVDDSIRDIQRMFTFDGTSVYDCLNQIAEEMSIIFDYTNRTVNAYDALSSCDDCGYRGHFTGTCPNCGGSNITEGFGDDTGICISTEALGSNLTYQRNGDAISNCYHVVGGDEIMTAAIRNCNPNGGYVWSFSDEMKSEMSAGLRSALNIYDNLYADYQTDHVFDVSGLPLTQYNQLIAKYKLLDSDVKVDPISSITGYSELIKAYYDAVDFGEYLNNSLYPSVTNNGKSAAQVVARLTDATLSPVSMIATDGITLSSASNAVLSYARIISDPLFDIKVVSQDLVKANDVWTWVGVLSVVNYYNKDDNAKTSTLHIVINSDIENYAQNSVKQTLLNRSKGNAEIINMYAMTDQELANALKYYSYQALSSINDCYVKSVEALTTIGANDPESDAYQIYLTTQAKLTIINTELALRESEVKLVDFKDSTTSMVALLTAMINSAKATMKIENNLTNAQWIELNSFRRESDYSNDNYVSTSFRKKFDYVDSQFISDALSNAELIKRAYEFLMMAEYKIKENNKYSYNISTTLQNLLAIPEFAGLRSSFKCGNWLRVMDSSGQLYKLRLMKYEVDFNDLSTISVEFADVSLNNSAMNKMQKWMLKTNDVVDRFGKSENQNNSNLINKSGDLTNDYNYSDSYGYQNVEIMGGQMTTKFNVLDGLIQGKISMDQAMSLIAQELGKITLTVQNGNKASTLTIKYDGVDISTSGNITLGGTVIFTGDLVDGETVISGDNIMTGEIKSANYVFRNGQIFSDSGSLFSLINGALRTPFLYSDNSGLHIKGTMYADAGYIGGSPIITTSDSYAVEHAQNAWKLRSGYINGQIDTKYYVSLTKNRNLVVSNSKDEIHTAENDVTDQCNIGTKSYPWRYGYFNRLYMDKVLLGMEYVKIELDATSWNSSNKQTVDITGIKKDDDYDDKVKQYVSVIPAYADAVDYYNQGIVLVQKKKNQLVFQRTNTSQPAVDVEAFVYVQNAKPKTETLDSPVNPSIVYDDADEVTYVSWGDPDDEMFTVWTGSAILRKKDAPPTYHFVNNQIEADTGSTLLASYYDEKDKYKENAYIDTTIKNEPKGRYYYTIVIIASEDETSEYTDTINTGMVPAIMNIDVIGSNCDISYQLQTGFYKSVKVVYKIGSEPETVNEGIVVQSLTNQTCNSPTVYNCEADALPTGTLYFKVFVKSDDGDAESNTVSVNIETEYEYGYTGEIQTFVAPETGVYSLEAWGAQGSEDGGYGGYSYGEVELQEGDILYIAVGGQDGWNGGGTEPQPDVIFNMNNTVLPSILNEATSFGNVVNLSDINSSGNDNNVFPKGKNTFLGEYNHNNEPSSMVVNVKYKHLWDDIAGFRVNLDGTVENDCGYGYVQYSANSNNNRFTINLRTLSNTIYGDTTQHSYNYTVNYTFADSNEHDIKCIFRYDYNEQYNFYCVQSWELYVDNVKIGYDTLWTNE